MSILDEIVESTRNRVEKESKLLPVDEMKFDYSSGHSLRESIEQASGVPVITEIKRASPSSGVIQTEIDLTQVVIEMTDGGSVGISVLTEPNYFSGRLDFVSLAREVTSLPILRKDFIVDEYQLYESARVGADVILLIAEVLGEDIPNFVETARGLGMECLVEVSSEDQLKLAVSAEPDLVGVNNRNLKNMKIDFSRTERLMKQIPDGTIKVSESGIRRPSEVHAMLEAGADAVLIGTSIMESEDIEEKVRDFTTLRG